MQRFDGCPDLAKHEVIIRHFTNREQMIRLVEQGEFTFARMEPRHDGAPVAVFVAEQLVVKHHDMRFCKCAETDMQHSGTQRGSVVGHVQLG